MVEYFCSLFNNIDAVALKAFESIYLVKFVEQITII